MFDITVKYGNCIYHGDGQNFISDWQLTKSRDDIDSFTFNIYPDNSWFTHIGTNLYAYGLEVLDENAEQVFYGRCIDVSPEMDANGLVYKALTYEGCKCVLLDSTYTLDAFTKVPKHQTAADFLNVDGQIQCVLYPYDVVCSDGDPQDEILYAPYCSYEQDQQQPYYYYDTGAGTHWDRMLDPNVNTLTEDNNYAITALDLVCSALAYHNEQMWNVGATSFYVTYEVSGDWQNYVIYKSPEYDSTTLDAVNAILEEAGAEMFASYDHTNQCVHLVIADRVYTSTAGTIALKDNMISCVQDIAPDELVTSVKIKIDGVSQDKVATVDNEDIAWTREHRASLDVIRTSINEEDGQDSHIADGWIEDVFDEFENTQYDYNRNHRYEYSNLYITELNSRNDYGGTQVADLTLSGLVNWSDYPGWENLKIIPADEDNDNTTPWFHKVIDTLIDEDLFKRIVRLGVAWLNERCRVIPSITISAVDMALLDDVNYDALEVGTWWRVYNTLIGVDDVLEIVSITWNQGSAHVPSVTLGRRPHRSVDVTTHVKKKADDTNKQSSSDDYSESRGTTTSMLGGSGSGSGKGASSTGGTEWRFQIVSEAPQVGVENTVYFVIPSSS